LLENDYFSHSIPLNTSQTQTAGANKCSCDHAPYVHAVLLQPMGVCFLSNLLCSNKCTHLAWHNIINGSRMKHQSMTPQRFCFPFLTRW